MDVRAMLLVEGRPGRLAAGETAARPELIAGVPIALLDVLGKPVLHRVAERLQSAGIQDICVISNGGSAAAAFERRAMRRDLRWIQAEEDQHFWRAAENCFAELAQAGAEQVLVFRLGAYAELDVDALLQFHLDQRSRVTAVAGPDGGLLDAFVISASRRNDAAFLFRHRLQRARLPCPAYHFDGYCNRLTNARDLRALAVDALRLQVAWKPEGEEIRPGVWAGKGAHIAHDARVLAPAFVGAHTRVRAAAVVTRCTALEHHVVVDCGTVVEDASILPYTSLGAGLDVCHAVVGFRRIAHLRRNVEVEVADPSLLGMVPTSGSWRTVTGAFSLAGFLPRELLRGMFNGRVEQPASLPAAVKLPSAALKSPATLHAPAKPAAVEGFSPDIVIARRYGNQ